jgi:serine/threonine protein kinase
MKPTLGEIIADKYRLERPLGEGGMGTVFAAVNLLTGKQVAIKWLKPELAPEEYAQRFTREAQIASRIEHPNVVNVFDVGRHEGALFLVMEQLYGEPLSAWLDHGVPHPEELLNLFIPVLRGVHAAHRIGVVHRDLKPDNIFICRGQHGESREPKVLDFGISKIAEGSLASQRQLTREGAVFGTPHYMAPELLRNTRAADPRSDVYSLGVILYRALAGQLPYNSDMLPALVLQVVEGRALHISHLCPELDLPLCDAVMRAMAPDPNDRFVSVAELARALEPYTTMTFEVTANNWLSPQSGEFGPRGPGSARVRTPASGPAREVTPRSLAAAAAQTSRSEPTLGDTRPSAPVDTERPSAEMVPTPVHGLRQRSHRSYVLIGAALVLLVGGPIVGWLVMQSNGQHTNAPVPPLPTLPAPAAAHVDAPKEPAQALPPSVPATELVPEPALAAPDVKPVTEEDKATQPSVSRHRSRAADGQIEAENRAPAAVEPRGRTPTEASAADPTLRSDNNPYLRH